MPKPRILAVDDDPAVLETLKVILGDTYAILTSATGADALRIVKEESVAAVFLDITLPDLNGLEVLRSMRSVDNRLPVIMATAADSARLAVSALQRGAFDYLTKPFNTDEVIGVARRAVLFGGAGETSAEQGFCNIIGKSKHVRELCALIPRVAATGSTVLIDGESGTGKELVAAALHASSSRRDKPFVPINCASIPDNLLESELFGYEKGAFTGALVQKIGMIELAQEGTLFLDEISDLRLDMQAKLLRVLETRQIKRLGGNVFIPVDVRIMSATNADLALRVSDGSFREDLYYRLNVIPIHLQPLRQRTEDIPLLARHYVRVFSGLFQKDVHSIEEAALACMQRYAWPGNIRELKNVIERLVGLASSSVLSHAEVDQVLSCAAPCSSSGGDAAGFKDACQDFQRRYIEDVLDKTNGNRVQAAKILGIHRNSLAQKLKALKIQ